MSSGALTVNFTTSAATCGVANGMITVIVTGGTTPYSYSIDGQPPQSSNIFPNLSPGAHTITVTDSGPDTYTDVISIGDLVGPSSIDATATAASCLNNDGGVTIIAVGGNLPLQYTLNGKAQAAADFTQVPSGPYTATVTDVNGCTVSQPVNVPLHNNLTVDAGNGITICQGTSGVINASSNGTSFAWSPATGLNAPNTLQPQASPDITTNYTLTATLGICQRISSPVTVTVNPAPIANAGPDASICYGQSAPLDGSGGLKYAWSPAAYLSNTGIADPTVDDPPGTMTYHLTVTDGNGCQSLNNAAVTITVIPPVPISAGNDTSIFTDQSVQLAVTYPANAGFTQFSWSPSIGLNDPLIQDPVATIAQTTTYTVEATTAAGCTSLASVTIKVFSVADIYVPGAFTPNGDGHNDIFRATLIGISQFKYLAVFNRWGQRVFYTENTAGGWDGTFNGQKADTGTYVWMAAGIDLKGTLLSRKGTVILIR